MFSSPKVAVLESKLDIYEELSREMLAKLESAVDKITEGNNKIANVLTKHESRLDESDRADQAILELVKRVEGNLAELEKKCDNHTFINIHQFFIALISIILQSLTTI